MHARRLRAAPLRETLAERHRLFGADLLAAEAGDAELRVGNRQILGHRQCRGRAMFDTGAASCAPIRIGLGSDLISGKLVSSGDYAQLTRKIQELVRFVSSLSD